MSSEMAIQSLIETVDAAINYRFQLSQVIDNLHEAKNQVQSSAAQSRTKLRSHFDCLRQCVVEALEERLAVLEHAVDTAESEALEPLNSCEELLNKQSGVAANIMDQGKQLLAAEDEQQTPSTGDAISLTDFSKRIKELDLSSLPEVPSLSEIPFIHLDLPRDEENVQRQLVDAIHDYGRVLKYAPVQIVDVSARPAAMLIKWAEMNQDEHTPVDLDIYRLEFCKGPVRCTAAGADSQEFVEAYVGPNCSYLVRPLESRVAYTFRVCGRVEGASSWSPWSAPVVWSTNLARYEWSPGTLGYSVTDDNAVIRFAGPSASVIYSKSNSYVCGHTLTFHVQSADSESLEVDDGVGLVMTDKGDASSLLRSKGFLFYSFLGGVYVDGQEKTTRLPAISASTSTITFETEMLPSNKVRVTVEVGERIITFDWPVPERQAQPGENLMDCFGTKEDVSKVQFFFAARLSKTDCSITVE